MNRYRLLALLLLLGAVGVVMAGRSCDRKDRHFADRFRAERVAAYLDRKLDLDGSQRRSLAAALAGHEAQFEEVRRRAAEVEPVFAAFRARLDGFLTADEVDELLELMRERRKEWKHETRAAVPCPDATSPSAAPPARVAAKTARAQAELTRELDLDAKEAARLEAALAELFGGFHAVRTEVYPRFYSLMDEVYGAVDWELEAEQAEALSALRARRAEKLCAGPAREDA